MRWIGSSVALWVVVAVAPARANDIYTWRDQHGISHYSNAPVPGAKHVDFYDAEIAPAAKDAAVAPVSVPTGDGAAAATTAAAAISDDERASFSNGASLRRQALERNYRGAQLRMRELDRALADLARFRVQHAREGTNAAGYQSDEEKSLAGEKAGLERDLEQSRRDYATLEGEVTARLGGMPDWWIALP